MDGEDFGDRHAAGGRDDLGVGVFEGETEAHGEPLADGAFARAHHADEHQRPFAKLMANGVKAWILRRRKTRSRGAGGGAIAPPWA